MASRDSLERANLRAKEMQASIPRALSARYDRRTGRIVIHLSSRLIVSFAPEDVEGLEDAGPIELERIEVSPSGFGIHFPAMDLPNSSLLDAQIGGVSIDEFGFEYTSLMVCFLLHNLAATESLLRLRQSFGVEW